MNEIRDNILNALFAGLFNTAYKLILEHPHEMTAEEKTLITALNQQFGDTGYIQGDMGVIIRQALDNIGVFDNENIPTLTLIK